MHHPSKKGKLFFQGLFTGMSFFIIFAALCFLLFPNGLAAVTIPDYDLGLGTKNPEEVILGIIAWALGLLALLAVCIILYGGFLWMTAAGNMDRIKKAKQVIVGAVIGLLIILSAWGIVLYLLNQLEDITGGGPSTPCEANCGNGICCGPAGENCLTCEADCGVCPGGSGFVVTVKDPYPNETNVFLCRLVQAAFNLNVDPDYVDADSFQVEVVTNSEPQSDSCSTSIAGSGDGEACNDNNECASGKCESNACVGDHVKGVFVVVDNVIQFIHTQDIQGTTCTTQGYNYNECPDTGLCDGSTCQQRAELLIDTVYRVNATRDIWSISGKRLTDNTCWEFITGNETDNDPPQVDLNAPDPIIPGDGDTDVCLAKPVQADFSEPMDFLSLMNSHPSGESFVLYQDSISFGDKFENLAFNVYSADLMTATPTVLFEENTGYEARIFSKSMLDSCANPLDGDFDSESEGATEDDFIEADGAWGTKEWNYTTGIDAECDPTITEINPTEGYYNETLAVSGKDFGAGGIAWFHKNVPHDHNCFGAADCQVSWGDSEIRVMMPYKEGDTKGAVSGPFYVETGDTRFSNSVNLTVKSPHITWMSPYPAPPTQMVTIAGINFGEYVEGESRVLFDGGSADLTTPCGIVWTNTYIIFKIPASASYGTHDIQVVGYLEGGAREGNLYHFEVADIPLSPGICGIDPENCGIVGDGRSIKGEKFGADPGTPNRFVYFGEHRVEDPAGFSSWTDEQIDVTLPNIQIQGANNAQAWAGERGSNLFPFTSPCGVEACDIGPLEPGCQPENYLCGALDCNPANCLCETPCDVDPLCAGGLGLEPCNVGNYCGADCFCKEAINCDDDPISPECEVNQSKCPEYFTCNEGTCYCDPLPVPYVVNDTYCEPGVHLPSPNPRPGATNVCLEAMVATRFNISMNVNSLPGNYKIEQCLDGLECLMSIDVTSAEFALPMPHYFTTVVENDTFVITPTVSMSGDTVYRVTLFGGDSTKIRSADDVPMADDYVWYFTTKPDGSICEVNAVMVVDNNWLTNTVPDTKDFTAWPVSEHCYLLNGNYSWDWSSQNDLVVTIAGANQNETATTTGYGSTNIQAEETASQKVGQASVNVDEIYCIGPNYDCTLGGACPGSECIDNACTPSITEVDPAPIGSTTTIRGCYFGSVQGNGKVEMDTIEAEISCQANGWRNEYILAKLPQGINDPADVKVIRDDSQERLEVDILDVTDDCLGVPIPITGRPELCVVNPMAGPESTQITYEGDNFTLVKGAGDEVFFDTVAGLTYPTWGDQLIEVNVPSGAVSGDTYTTVENCESNRIPNFRVTCTTSGDCGTGCCYQGQCEPLGMCSGGGAGEDCDNNDTCCALEAPPECSQSDYYNCLSECPGEGCKCCCDPGPPPQEMNGLICTPDRSPCTSGNRGLYCGCLEDADCLDVPNVGCGTDACCHGRPTVLDITPDDGALNVCRNAVIEVAFSDIMDTRTLDSDSVKLWQITGFDCGMPSEVSEQLPLVQKIWHQVLSFFKNIMGNKALADDCPVEGNITTLTREDQTVLLFQPTELLNDEEHYFEISTAASNQYGVSLYNKFESTFEVGNRICMIDRVQVDKNSPEFAEDISYDLFSDDVNPHEYRAVPKSSGGQSLTADHYEWTDTGLPADVISIESPSAQITNVNVAQLLNDQEEIEIAAWTNQMVCVGGDHDGEGCVQNGDCEPGGTCEENRGTGNVTAEVFLCEDPWSYSDSEYNYKLLYCNDQLLNPPLDLDEIDLFDTSGNPDLLKHVQFREDSSSDEIIWLQIWTNEDRLSPARWYLQYAPNPGSPSSLSVDGYEAIQEGATVYVAATNDDGPCGTLYTNIYILALSSGASADMNSIYSQMLGNWTFNTNLNVTEKQMVINDTIRVVRIGEVGDLMNDYWEENNQYPALEAGSYLEGYSTSKWESWQSTLANAVGTSLPLDVYNVFAEGECAGCPGDINDPHYQCDQNCWNDDTKVYECKNGSYIYQYTYDQDSLAYLYGNLEYTCGDWDNYNGNPCSNPHSCRCFNYNVELQSGSINIPLAAW